LKNPENVDLSDSVTTNSKRTFMQTRLRLIFCLAASWTHGIAKYVVVNDDQNAALPSAECRD